jgi:hypothetical protein
MNHSNLIHISEAHFCSKSRKRNFGRPWSASGCSAVQFYFLYQAVNIRSVFAEPGLNLRPVHVFVTNA